MSPVAVSERNGVVRFAVYVKPRSSRSRVEGAGPADALVVALKAPPVDGAANTELIKLLANLLSVKKAAVSIASGHNARRKVIDVAGVSRDFVIERFQTPS